jgi:hypothetical protein
VKLLAGLWNEVISHRAELEAAGVHPAGGGWPETWVFLWEPRVPVQGTGMCSVVLSVVRAWAGANRHNSLRFPTVQVEVYADIAREPSAAPDRRSAWEKAEGVWSIVDRVCHRPDGGGFTWGGPNGVFVVSSLRATGDPEWSEVPETDGVIRALARYDVELP